MTGLAPAWRVGPCRSKMFFPRGDARKVLWDGQSYELVMAEGSGPRGLGGLEAVSVPRPGTGGGPAIARLARNIVHILRVRHLDGQAFAFVVPEASRPRSSCGGVEAVRLPSGGTVGLHVRQLIETRKTPIVRRLAMKILLGSPRMSASWMTAWRYYFFLFESAPAPAGGSGHASRQRPNCFCTEGTIEKNEMTIYAQQASGRAQRSTRRSFREDVPFRLFFKRESSTAADRVV